DLSVVRGAIEDYETRHPDPEDVALVVEVTRSSVAKDRALARVYGGGGIPVYWIVNVPKRRLEVCEAPGSQRGACGSHATANGLRDNDSMPHFFGGGQYRGVDG